MRETLLTALAAMLGFACLASAIPVGPLPNSDPEFKDNRPRLPFMVPEGTTNIALHKEVTNSTPPIKGSLKMVTDGKKEPDEVDGEYIVDLKEGKQWVQIDLTEMAAIYAVILWLGDGPGMPRSCNDVVVQVSDDKDFKKGVKIIFNNDHDNSSSFGVGKNYNYWETNEGKLVDAKGMSARYVRVNTNGNTLDPQNHFTEIEVWGLTRKKPSGKMVPLESRFPKPWFR